MTDYSERREDGAEIERIYARPWGYVRVVVCTQRYEEPSGQSRALKRMCGVSVDFDESSA